MKSDIGLEVLLSLDGTEYTEENGYWHKIEASRVEPTKERPHGIRYNLTLHDNYNQRILGFDNAHAVKAKKHGYYTGSIVSYDHMHRSIKDKGIPYEFESAQQLLNDFLNEVNSIMSKLNNGGN
ncbi:Uncharacterised protein (plasmid) [Legionella adelaidensis]|uniref:Uncharacterized protein n=1 Tax=Legionella adelaidensis TaxID=45056 RepID=A0A0W0R1R0_9GAMM|nr:DUF6516 family protein [Legionella adelaidensis]KTC65020.1 hypothetical protein Lade_1543 [Legionella adelaidensis]VEH85461.1 Uncharacterised protein [Legionella adelaidensis]